MACFFCFWVSVSVHELHVLDFSMETVVDIVGNEEAKVEDSVAARNKPTPTSLQMIADPVVYQLVRVYHYS